MINKLPKLNYIKRINNNIIHNNNNNQLTFVVLQLQRQVLPPSWLATARMTMMRY